MVESYIVDLFNFFLFINVGDAALFLHSKTSGPRFEPLVDPGVHMVFKRKHDVTYRSSLKPIGSTVLCVFRSDAEFLFIMSTWLISK